MTGRGTGRVYRGSRGGRNWSRAGFERHNAGSQDYQLAVSQRREKRKTAEPVSAIDHISTLPSLRLSLLNKLPTEILHQILDDIPEKDRVKVLLCIADQSHFTACVRSHNIHGKGLELLENKDLPMIVGLLRIERRLWGSMADVKRKLPIRELPKINGRIYLFFFRHLSGISLIDTARHVWFDYWDNRFSMFEDACYIGDKYPEHYHFLSKKRSSRSYSEVLVHDSSSTCPILLEDKDSCWLHLNSQSASLEADRLCLNRRRRGHSILPMSRAVYKAGCHLRATQLHQMADLLDTHSHMLRSSFDSERAVRVNREHLQQNIRSRAKICEAYQVRGSDKPPASLKSIGPYFRGPCLPIMPLDYSLDLVVQSLALELAGQSQQTTFTTGEDLAAWLQSLWAEKLAKQEDQELATLKAAQDLFEGNLNLYGRYAREVKPRDFKQLGEDIQTFIIGLGHLYDYKRTELLPRIEKVSSAVEAKGKQSETNPEYDLASRRYERLAMGPTDLTASPCSRGLHKLQRARILRTVQKQWQFIDYMSVKATRTVAMDNLSAPVDEREIEWLEAFLRLGKVFGENWTWRKKHDGDCSCPQPLMTREMGIRRAAWLEGLERGREIENPLLAAQNILKRSKRVLDLPGERPWYV